MHSSLLSALPVMQGWNRPWSADDSLAGEVKKELSDARKSNRQEVSQWYRIAQLRLLSAFRTRKGTAEPFLYSPGDRIVFNRGEGAESAASLKRILDQPEAKRKGWTRGALALTGFFHFSDQNPGLALDFFRRALAIDEDTDQTGISRHMIVLLTAQAALVSRKAPEAEMLLEKLLTEDELPDGIYARAMELFAGTLFMQGRTDRVNDLLGKTLKTYRKIKDRAGIARVHLRLAALALEQGRTRDASRALSLAASLANGLDDGFTLNMVGGLSQYFPRVL
jgi:tetratricopeptide (TPR) repeat protein